MVSTEGLTATKAPAYCDNYNDLPHHKQIYIPLGYIQKDSQIYKQTYRLKHGLCTVYVALLK